MQCRRAGRRAAACHWSLRFGAARAASWWSCGHLLPPLRDGRPTPHIGIATGKRTEERKPGFPVVGDLADRQLGALADRTHAQAQGVATVGFEWAVRVMAGLNQ